MSHFNFFQINFPNYVKAIQNLNADLKESDLQGILVVVSGPATTAPSMWLHGGLHPALRPQGPGIQRGGSVIHIDNIWWLW